MMARIVFVVVAFSMAAFGADAGLMSLVMPDAVALAGINADQVRTSPFGQFLLSKVPPNDPGLQQLITQTGFDPRQDIHEVLLASNAPVQAPRQGPPTSGLALVRGNFDVNRILDAVRAKGGASVETYHGVPMIVGQGGKGAVAFPDATLAIAGDTDNVRAAIDRRSSPSAPNAALTSGAQSLSAAQDAWAISLGPITPPGATGPQQQLLSKIQQTTWGLKLGSDIVLSGAATLPTDQDAAALAQVLQFLAGMAQIYGPQNNSPGAALLKDVKITTSGNQTLASLSVAESAIEQLLPQAGHKPPRLGMMPPRRR